jgi:amino acid transporter
MPQSDKSKSPDSNHLTRGLGLLEASAVNMNNMIGMGPFITIPVILSAMGGPQAMLGWLVGLVIALADGLVWSELAAAFPGTGGSYQYLKEVYGKLGLGRLMAFLFVWLYLISGPMEIATGYIGFSNYLGYFGDFWKNYKQLIAAGLGVLNLLFLYRPIKSIGKLNVILWVGILITAFLVVASGLPHFDSKLAFAFTPNAFHFDLGFVLGLGTASQTAIYDYLGYYSVCYVGDEVREPAKTLPRSIVISLVCVGIIYLLVNLSVIGVLPWQDAAKSDYVISDFMQKLWGTGVAKAFTLLLLWTSLGSVFALLLGYSRIPYAAARDGVFFKVFGKLHPSGHFPHISLVLVGLLAAAFSFLPLDAAIAALLATRILIQFLAQCGGIFLLRKHFPDKARPYKMFLYPIPVLISIVGWVFVFGFTKTSWGPLAADSGYSWWSLIALAVGLIFYGLWRKFSGQGPDARSERKANKAASTAVH